MENLKNFSHLIQAVSSKNMQIAVTERQITAGEFMRFNFCFFIHLNHSFGKIVKKNIQMFNSKFATLSWLILVTTVNLDCD